MRYIYSGATKTIQYVFISVGLAATVIRLAMMSYVLLRKFLLWRSGAKDQGLYPIFFSYFYPGKWSSGCHWVQENFTIENFSLTCRSIALFIWREREKKKKEVVTTTKIFMRKALILLFLSFIILRIWRWREYVSWKHRLGLSSGCLELIICVKIRIRFRDFKAGKGFLFNYQRQNYRDSRLPVCA